MGAPTADPKKKTRGGIGGKVSKVFTGGPNIEITTHGTRNRSVSLPDGTHTLGVTHQSVVPGEVAGRTRVDVTVGDKIVDVRFTGGLGEQFRGLPEVDLGKVIVENGKFKKVELDKRYESFAKETGSNSVKLDNFGIDAGSIELSFSNIEKKRVLDTLRKEAKS